MAELYGFASSIDEARLLLEAGVPIVQYRNKGQDRRDVVTAVRTIMTMAVNYPDVRIIVNDSIEAAVESGAHGVHLGQDDGNVRQICREYRDRLIIGVSIDTVDEALDAERAGAHYIGAGAVYGSFTKPEAPTMGVPLLRSICQSVRIPVSAIGGITYDRLDEIIDAGAGYVCVLSDINNHADPIARARCYITHLKEREHEK